MLASASRITQGVIDSHIHIYPEISLKIHNASLDEEWISEAINAGMRAVCLKSHYWPTVDKAFTLGTIFRAIDVVGGIVLNHTVGGLNPLAVRVAIENGGRVVWFPTWSAANDLERSGYSKRVLSIYRDARFQPLSILDSENHLIPDVKNILKLIADNDICLATGHLSVRESKILIAAAREMGIGKIVFTHALTAVISASVEDQKIISDMGAFIEHCFIATLPNHQRLSLEKIVESIRCVGAGRCIISSDAVFAWNPTPPQMMRMFIAGLQELGIQQDEIDLMTKRNPAYTLGIEEKSESRDL